MTTSPACPPPSSSPSSPPSRRYLPPCAASWTRSEYQQTLLALRAAQALATRLATTERDRPTATMALRVEVVTDEAVEEWVRLYRAVAGLLEAERLDDDGPAVLAPADDVTDAGRR